MREKAENGAGEKAEKRPSNRQLMTWAALIKCIYEVDPLKCPKCGGTMKIISFIEQDEIIERILKHCGLWKESQPRPPPEISTKIPALEEPLPDYTTFEDLPSYDN